MSSACLDRMKLKWKKTLSPYGRNTPLIKSDKFFIAVFALMALWIFVPSARRAQGTMLWCIHYFPIVHNAFCLSPKFCINYCYEILLGGLHIPKNIPQQQFMQNLGGKQSALWTIGK